MRERDTQADAIVVLGCRLRRSGPSAALSRRVALGVELYRAGRAPLLLLSGGSGEAAAMRALAIEAGVPEGALLCEDTSRNTAENAANSARLLRERGLGRVVLVSHRAHLLRARLLFRRTGVTVVGATGVEASSPAQALFLALYEAAALPYNLLRLISH